MMVLGQTPQLAAWVTQKDGKRHLCRLVGTTWFGLCGAILLDTEDGPRIPYRCQECQKESGTEGLVFVRAENVIRV